MHFNPTSEDEAGQAITRIVDGTLEDSERDAVESWVAANSEIARQVALQRQIAHELSAGGPAPPDRLIAAIEQRYRDRGREWAPRRSNATAGGRRTPSPRRARGGRRNWWLPAASVGVAVVAVLAVVVATSGGGATPSIDAAARLAFVPASTAAPQPVSARYLDVDYAGVTFPNYAKLSAPVTGQLISRIGGRPALTVYYRLSNGAHLSYTVFSGKPVTLPASARLVRYEGVPLHVYRLRDGLSVVTLVRFGRTCVLAARAAEDVVLGLAAEPVLAEHA
jgi:anti-sigma factor RsiW